MEVVQMESTMSPKPAAFPKYQPKRDLSSNGSHPKVVTLTQDSLLQIRLVHGKFEEQVSSPPALILVERGHNDVMWCQQRLLWEWEFTPLNGRMVSHIRTDFGC